MSWGKGNMGQGNCAQERDVVLLMFELLEKHSKSLPPHDLKVVLKWAEAEGKKCYCVYHLYKRLLRRYSGEIMGLCYEGE